MMTITKFEPFRQVARLQDRMNRVFEDMLGHTFDDNEYFRGTWTPAADILESTNEVTLRVELPGMKPEDVDIRIENNTLTLQGERKLESREDKANFHRRERVFGAFTRSFALPSTIDQDKVSAEFKDGVLQVILPKKEEIKPKQISIKAK